MNTRQIIAYAKDNGYNSVKFSLKRNGNHLVAGEFLDAYFEFVKIPFLGDGFVTISQLEEQLGYNIEFDVINDDVQYITMVRLDFMLRGKDLPEKYAFTESEGENND
jgi:hypothetical protein